MKLVIQVAEREDLKVNYRFYSYISLANFSEDFVYDDYVMRTQISQKTPKESTANNGSNNVGGQKSKKYTAQKKG